MWSQFRVLDVTDLTASAWEEDSKINTATLDTSAMQGADNQKADVPGEMTAPTFSYKSDHESPTRISSPLASRHSDSAHSALRYRLHSSQATP